MDTTTEMNEIFPAARAYRKLLERHCDESYLAWEADEYREFYQPDMDEDYEQQALQLVSTRFGVLPYEVTRAVCEMENIDREIREGVRV